VVVCNYALAPLYLRTPAFHIRQAARKLAAPHAQQAQDLAGLDGKAGLLDGQHVGVLAVKEAAHGRRETRFALGHLEGFVELFDQDFVFHCAKF